MIGTIINCLIYGITAIFMFGIGIFQLKSKEPVAFYSGENPPKREQLTDVNAWNKKHGWMWIIYGFCIVGSLICAVLIGDSIYSVIPLVVGMFVPIVFMVIYHHKLVKKYMIK